MTREEAMRVGLLGRAGRLCAATAVALMAMGAVASTPVFAEDAVEDEIGTCKDECTEARRMCYAAAHAAYKFCWDECEATLQESIARALDACRDEGLSPADCDRYVQKATRYAAQECRDDCRKARKRARKVCRAERQECRQACEPAPGCARECVGGFVECREGVDACADSCKVIKRAGLEECREIIADACDPEAFRACVKEVRHEYRGCVDTCHEEGSCGEGLRECLGSCVDDVDDAVAGGDVSEGAA